MDPDRRQICSLLASLVTVPGLLTRGSRPPGGPRSGRGPDSLQVEAFLEAVCAGDLSRVQALLEAEPELASSADDGGRSALVLACLEGHVGVAELLRGEGLELDLVEAVLAEDWARVESLAQSAPEALNAAHAVGGTPLHAAALVGSLDMWRLRSLGCDPDRIPAGGDGFSPARAALESREVAWARIALTDLASNGADVNVPQRDGSSVLHGAVARRDEDLVRLAIRKGADGERKDRRGRTPLALARELAWSRGVELLEDPSRWVRDDRSSRFALDANREPIEFPDLSEIPRERQSEVTSSSHFNLKRVRELVSADRRLVFSISSDDELAIEACAHTGARDVIRYHLDQGAPLSLPTAVSLGDEESVAFWLERSPSLIHERGAHDYPVLWYAVLGGGSVPMAELLVHHGVPLDQETMGATALHGCARRGDHDLAEWLLAKGADPEAVGYRWSRDGQTPLQVAQAAGDPKMVALLGG